LAFIIVGSELLDSWNQQKAIHPEVCAYVDDVMATVRTLIEDDQIDRLVVSIRRRGVVVERLVLRVESFFSRQEPRSGGQIPKLHQTWTVRRRT